MHAEQQQAIQACAQGTLAGQLTFLEIVGRLAAIGVERYHADYSRHEITYYLPDGDSYVVPLPHPPRSTATAFSSNAVKEAVYQSQQNQHTYLDFIRKTQDAGCVGYFVQITGRRAIYFGRNGETHFEFFPPAPASVTGQSGNQS